jgi:aminoglycoside phosphotransferase (APT) family kinase protein
MPSPPPSAMAAAAETPPDDRLVVCQGDACAPNTILTPDGRCSGHVDLGSLGVADRWVDLAIATWSTDWHYGPGWQRHLVDASGQPASSQASITSSKVAWRSRRGGASPHSSRSSRKARCAAHRQLVSRSSTSRNLRPDRVESGAAGRQKREVSAWDARTSSFRRGPYRT